MKLDKQLTGERVETPLDNVSFADPDEGNGRTWLILAIVAIVTVIAGAAYFYSQPSTAGAGETAIAAGDDNEKQAQNVTVIVPGSGLVERRINASGTFAARREMPVGVAGEGGQVARVMVQPGDWVKKGAILAYIDRSVQNQQAQQQAAQIDVSQADLKLAEANLERAQKLVGRGFISQADIDQRIATRDQARARVNVAKAQYNELLARAGRLNIVAPESGLVLERNVEPGQVVSAGSGVLFRLAAGGEMELRAQLSESDLSSLSNGVKANITPTGSQEVFTGQVWQIAPVINQTTRQGTARIALPYNQAIRPGGFGNAVIISGSSSSPILPQSAVQSDNDGSYVYIVGKDNKVERRDIETGAVNAAGITILSGLKGNEKVVLYAAGFLNPGELVVPQVQKPEATPTTATTAQSKQPAKG
ncbi:efflux RND transporter periplasmic adaptor subunit [Parasphingorhabdus sp. DH2-15]|uniref:efflux RND transporter periplasmic adaptor subunit n=1 Tax=Parasphingorhabdus sp. DH2-15 TaxID=3444112 RepID=UPI003F688C19